MTCCTETLGSASEPTCIVRQRSRVRGVDRVCLMESSIIPSVIRRRPTATGGDPSPVSGPVHR